MPLTRISWESLGLRCGWVDVQPAVHPAAAHDEPTGVPGAAGQGAGVGRVDAQQQAALIAGCKRHVAVDQEGQPPNILFSDRPFSC